MTKRVPRMPKQRNLFLLRTWRNVRRVAVALQSRQKKKRQLIQSKNLKQAFVTTKQAQAIQTQANSPPTEAWMSA